MSHVRKVGLSHSPASDWSTGAGMGWVMMSERELQRVEVLTSVITGRTTIEAAAAVPPLAARLGTREPHRRLHLGCPTSVGKHRRIETAPIRARAIPQS